MDTAVSSPPLAMGQGEQHAVHPFFRQEFGVPIKSTSALPNTPVNFSQATSVPNPSSASNHQPNAEYDSQVKQNSVLESRKTQHQAPSSPEDDPNANGRKRRKTDKPKPIENETTVQAGLSGWLGRDLSSTSDPSNPALGFGSDVASPSLDPQLSNIVPGQQPTNAGGQIHNDSSDASRKVLKLNSNGRLLSSPPCTAESVPQKARGGRPRRSRKGNTKLVILKYNPNSPKNIGSLIDEILRGEKVHALPAPQLVPSSNHHTPPTKPTHPFFAKKSAPKAQNEPTTDYSASSLPSGSKAPVPSEKKREPRAFSSPMSTFGRRQNKFPELVHPLWPPRDLVHIRSLDSSPAIHTPGSKTVINDQKKSKLRTINVSDEENVLLVATASARQKGKLRSKDTGHGRDNLRHPTRNVSSGRVLQTAIDSQLASSLPHRPAKHPSHPAISKLWSGLLSSFSAFDCGKYESQLWAHKYAPKAAEEVLQIGREVQVLRDWLEHLKINAVDTGKPSKEGANSKSKRDNKRKNRRKKADKLDGFIVSSEEEASEMDNLSGSDDELAGDVTVSSRRTVVRSGDMASSSKNGGDKVRVSNAILLSGPPGSGKTASVYAVAKELDFEVFEINAGSRRSARDMLERVGDMTQNHLVHLLNDSDDTPSKSREPGSNEAGKQNKLMGFFKSQPHKTPEASAQSSPKADAETSRRREQKQSLILIEEADILFDEDKQFWTGILTLISQSRRPIVITCNEESLVPTQGMSLHAILRFPQPPPDLVLDYLLLVAANEGHLLKRDAVGKLYAGSRFDIRRSLMDLNLWCQIGVGSEKAGLDWILPQWPPGANVDQNGDRVRVLSLNTYEQYMGWFNRDCFLEEGSLEKEPDALKNSFHWWDLDVQESEDAAGFSKAELVSFDQSRPKSKLEQLQLLNHEADYAEMRSSLDLLCSGCPLDMAQDVMDITAPPMVESHRSNYVEAYPLLQVDLQPEYTSLSETMGITFDTLLSRVFRLANEDLESAIASRIFNGWTKAAGRRLSFPPTIAGFQRVFEPIRKANYSMPIPSGRLGASFENGLGPITEDLAPYIRAIMVFDGRLKQYRDQLHAIWAQEQGYGEKRTRTTRASRAALEGSDKASTRKERWFPDDTNYFLVQATGKPEWQEILFQMGHFHVQLAVEPTEGPVDDDAMNG